MDDDGLTAEERRIETRRFDLAMRRLLAGDLTEAEAAELDAINAAANAVRPTPEPTEVSDAVAEAKTLLDARRSRTP